MLIFDQHITCMHIMCEVPGLNKRLRVRWAVIWAGGWTKA